MQYGGSPINRSVQPAGPAEKVVRVDDGRKLHQRNPELKGALQVRGSCAPEFSLVRREFERNFDERGEQGAACAIYHRGTKVVDLWGGIRSTSPSRPWNDQTLVLAFSATKGMAAAAMVVAHSRGLFELDQPIARYWPEFSAGGKADITVRELLAHQAGLISIGQELSPELIAQHDQMAELLAEQSPAWVPGTYHGYHTLTLGWYQSELLRRVDPKRRSLGVFFREEIAQPLGVEFYIGLPPEVDADRLALTKGFHRLSILAHLHELPATMVLSGLWPRSLVARTVRTLRLNNPAEIGGPGYRRVEVPSANGIGQAEAIAKVYGVLATGGRELGVDDRTYSELVAPAQTPKLATRDVILKIDTRYAFGFSRPSRAMQFGCSPRAFGCPGAGGAFGMGDPEHAIGYAYLTSKMGYRLFDDRREKAVRDACYQCLAAIRASRGKGRFPSMPHSSASPRATAG